LKKEKAMGGASCRSDNAWGFRTKKFRDSKRKETHNNLQQHGKGEGFWKKDHGNQRNKISLTPKKKTFKQPTRQQWEKICHGGKKRGGKRGRGGSSIRSREEVRRGGAKKQGARSPRPCHKEGMRKFGESAGRENRSRVDNPIY